MIRIKEKGKWKMVVLLIVFCLTFVAVRFVPQSELDYAIIDVEGGYGYTISKKQKVIIFQQFIPNTKGYSVFQSQAEARRVARLVIKKLEHGQSPSLNSIELNEALNL